jgi:transcription initiation factor IIE alpha subunit
MKKKEIWKLLELLNEYDSKSWWEETDEWIDNIWKIYEFHSELQIISKKYGFIQRLVDNDKIDKRQVHILCWTDDMEYNYSEEELILMELAISDTPIEDLLLYLN